jgi:hypothetical protein
LDAATKLKEAMASSDPARIDEIIRTDEAQKIVQELINKIQATPTSLGEDLLRSGGNPLSAGATLLAQVYGGDSARAELNRQTAGVVRGALGVVNRVVFGLADLVKFAAKHNPTNPNALIHDALSMKILQEHLRLGNICMECVQHEAKAMGKELLKPVTEPWSKGEYAEAITAGGLELALIVGPIVAKIGGMMKAAQATRAAEIARAEALRAELAAADAAQRAKLATARAQKAARSKPTGVAVEKPPVPKAPLDFDHIIGADYNKKTGKPTGGHSTVNGDVKIKPGTEGPPDASGVYKASVQMPDPQNPGQWIDKTSNGGVNTMFPKEWSGDKIRLELDSAWATRQPHPTNPSMWQSTTPSGVKVEGYTTPKATAYPVFQGPK